VTRAAEPERDRAARAHWVLPPPDHKIPAQVRALTGFHEGVLSEALAPEAVWQLLREQLPESRPAATAIHYARFELGFLKDWAQRFEPDQTLPLDAVCVHAIAERLYPDLPRRNLRALAGFLGHSLHLERRALGHVLATAHIWRKLLEILSERGITTWPELKAWLEQPKPTRSRTRRYPLPSARYRQLPDAPGVYRMLRSNGDVLYVGKAASLRQRVGQHFTKHRGATERALEMLTQVGDLAFTLTETALEAAVLEAETIKRLRPPYNVQLIERAEQRRVWYAARDFRDLQPERDARHPLGPLPSRYAVDALASALELLSGEPATEARRAGAVGSPLRFAPDESVFTEGWALLSTEHFEVLQHGAGPRRMLLELVRRLNAAPLEGVADEDENGEDESDELEPPNGWDAPRVLRNLERALVQAHRLARRAAWFRLLQRSVVAYVEPGSTQWRVLWLADAAIVESAAFDGGSLQEPNRPAAAPEQPAFDHRRYEGLRVLTTELKRILRDGGGVRVRLSRSRELQGPALTAILRLV
jgi:DNA polymerase-3 subunit epsilon